jgi:hypothetical protein
MSNHSNELPYQHIVYKHYDHDCNLLYVGVTSNFADRCTSHSRKAAWWNSVVSITLEDFTSREEAELAEAIAIEKEFPSQNQKSEAHKIPDDMKLALEICN